MTENAAQLMADLLSDYNQIFATPPWVQNRNDTWWYEAPLPRRRHKCEPWTIATDPKDLIVTWRCACGNIGWPDLGWHNEKNSRRP